MWVRQFGERGEDTVRAAATDLVGHIYAAGSTDGESFGTKAALLAKYDAEGNQLWVREFGPSGFSTSARDVDTGAAGNVYLLATAGNLFGTESFLVKYTADGAQVWSRPISGPLEPTRLATDTFGHVYLVGRTSLDAFVAQYDGLGNQVWLRQFGNPSTDIAQGVATNALGDVYVVGLQDGYDLEASFLARYDTAGTQHWVRSFSGDSFPPWAMTVAADAHGNAVVAGFVWGTFAGETSAGHFDAFVLAYDRAGTQGWVRLFGTPEQDQGADIAIAPAGNIYVAGTTHGTFTGEASVGPGDAFLAHLTTTPVGSNDGIAELRTTLAGMAIPDGIRRSLDAKLAAAQRAAAAGHVNATCGPLTAFANEVSAQDGKKLTAAQATLLRSAIDVALADGGCRG